MGKYVLSAEAVEDLELIWGYIAQDNPAAANRVLDAAERICEVLAGHPELGILRRFEKPEFSGIRSFPVTDFPNYLIFYRATEGGVQIIRVLHGARNIEKLFGE